MWEWKMTEKLLPGTVAVGPTGLKWHYEGPETDDHLPILGHEMGIVNMALFAFPKGGVFVDVGAHVGLYALELARKAEQVIAIEANFSTWEKLEKNILLNDLGSKITTINAAAWNKKTRLDMVDPNDKVSGGSRRCIPAAEWGSVQADKLDTLLKHEDLARVDMIKIDVEGAEKRVLKGARKTLMEFQPTLLVEMHDFIVGPENRREVEDELEAVGYVHGDDIPYGEGYSWVARPA
jgi:FkbM family methyltransferase